MYKEFIRSFRLDNRFFLVWLMDVLFASSVSVIFYLSLFRFGSISQRLIDLQNADATQAVVDSVYNQAYLFFGTIVLCALLIFACYVIFQAMQWMILLRSKIDGRFVGRFALFLIIAAPFVLAPMFLLSLAVLGLFSYAANGASILVVIYGAILAWLAYSIIMPFAVFPTYAFFKERAVFASLGSMFSLAFASVPKLWPHYLAAGLVMVIVTQLYHVINKFAIDPSLGGFLLVAVLIAPVLSWYRFYIVGLLQKSH